MFLVVRLYRIGIVRNVGIERGARLAKLFSVVKDTS